jgi:hypothetical protein
MRALWLSRTTLVWALLVGATMLSWALGHGIGFRSARTAGAVIIVVTFVKVRFVILEFMEIRHAPRWMRFVGEAWIVVIATLLIGLFVGGSR